MSNPFMSTVSEERIAEALLSLPILPQEIEARIRLAEKGLIWKSSWYEAEEYSVFYQCSLCVPSDRFAARGTGTFNCKACFDTGVLRVRSIAPIRVYRGTGRHTTNADLRSNKMFREFKRRGIIL